jgi:signal transduction histidine kinase
MRRPVFLRFFLIGLIIASLLSALSMLGLARMAELAARPHRSEFLVFLATNIEQNISDSDNAHLKDLDLERLLSRRGGPPHELPQNLPHNLPRRPLPEIWILSESGKVLAQTYPEALPSGTLRNWKQNKSLKAHEVFSQSNFLQLQPQSFVVRLDRAEPTYLVFKDHNPLLGPLFSTQVAMTFATTLCSLILSFLILLFYLRRKSDEARAVLLRLERGDLKARFHTDRFDEFSGLVLDFNRMAQEIERLVEQIKSTEKIRNEFLQELGHDLRTPLTSLTTSFETLQTHFKKLSDEQREEILSLTASELSYFKELLEKLMTISSIDTPNYKASSESVTLDELLSAEIKARQAGASRLQWTYNVSEEVRAAEVVGDTHLLLRVFKNAFDNSARFAKALIAIDVSMSGDDVQICILDDGPGLTAEQISFFGSRRRRRFQAQQGTSLGLGSVIMKTIVELHGGHIEIQNRPTGSNQETGAQVIVTLPLRKA